LKLAVELSCLSEPEAGMQVYTKHFVESLSRSTDKTVQLLLFSDCRSDFSGVQGENVELLQLPSWVRSRVFREQIVVPTSLLFRDINPDRLIVPAYLGPLWSPCPVDLIVYDLEFLEERGGHNFKDRCYWKGLHKLIFRRADCLWPCSQTTRNELIEQFPNLESKVGPTLYPGVKQGVDVRNQYDFNPQKPFLLFVGTISPRKNVDNLIEFYCRSPKEFREQYELRIVGKHGWGQPEPETLRALEAGIHWHGRVNESRLTSFYEEAEALILPSLGEGFGLPILEAFKTELPVVVSDLDIFREVAGNAGLYLPDAKDPSTWIDVVETVLGNPAVRRQKIIRGTRRLRRFRWAKTTQRYLRTVTKSRRRING
jgi:glycosyltransferase involved in cell wall biosynthesis